VLVIGEEDKLSDKYGGQSLIEASSFLIGGKRVLLASRGPGPHLPDFRTSPLVHPAITPNSAILFVNSDRDASAAVLDFLLDAR
jgi:hypothetical protein